MIDSIYVGMTGLLGYSQGLKTISNNTANMDTPGFKSSSLQFTDLFYSQGNLSGGSGSEQQGFGLNTASTTLNFKQGDLSNTGNDLDLAIDGTGLFTLKDSAGKIHYTRAGQFQFDTNGILVNKTDGSQVMGLNGQGDLQNISIAGLLTNPAKATSTVTFSGNLSSTAATQTVSSVNVLDSTGTQHALSLQLTNNSATAAGGWTVNVLDGTTNVGSGVVKFSDGQIVPSASKISFTYAPAGSSPVPITLDFGNNVTSFAAGSTSTLAMASQDGIAAGGMTKATFDTDGRLSLTYSNGQTISGTQLALGRFDTLDAVLAIGGNQFDASDPTAWHTGAAGIGGFGAVKADEIELSNVDLSQEFSDLVIMQRGYQSSSQIISTANEMMQELFSMKDK